MKHPFFIQTVLLEQTTLVWKICPLFFYRFFFYPIITCFAIINSSSFIYFKNFISVEKWCFWLNSYTKHLTHLSFLNAQQWVKLSLQYLEVLSVFFFLVRLVFSCIILLYLRVLLLLLIYENRLCLWNSYFSKLFSSIWLGLKPYFADRVLFKLLVALLSVCLL